eukprot:EG_transcript_43847
MPKHVFAAICFDSPRKRMPKVRPNPHQNREHTRKCCRQLSIAEGSRPATPPYAAAIPSQGAPKPQQFNVSVVARFRPKGALRHAASTKPAMRFSESHPRITESH